MPCAAPPRRHAPAQAKDVSRETPARLPSPPGPPPSGCHRAASPRSVSRKTLPRTAPTLGKKTRRRPMKPVENVSRETSSRRRTSHGATRTRSGGAWRTSRPKPAAATAAPVQRDRQPHPLPPTTNESPPNKSISAGQRLVSNVHRPLVPCEILNLKPTLGFAAEHRRAAHKAHPRTTSSPAPAHPAGARRRAPRSLRADVFCGRMRPSRLMRRASVGWRSGSAGALQAQGHWFKSGTDHQKRTGGRRFRQPARLAFSTISAPPRECFM